MEHVKVSFDHFTIVFVDLFSENVICIFRWLLSTNQKYRFETNTIGFLVQFCMYRSREIPAVRVEKSCVIAPERFLDVHFVDLEDQWSVASKIQSQLSCVHVVLP